MTKNGSLKMSGGGNKSQGLPATTNMRSGPIRNYVFSQAYSPPEKRLQIQVPLVTGGTKSSFIDSSGEKWILHTFSTSGIFTVPSGLSLPIEALIIGGGGGGGAANARANNGGATSMSAAGGGGGGGEVISVSTTINEAISVVVGLGGAGGTASVYTGPTNGTGGEANNAWSNNGGFTNPGADGLYSSFDSTVASGGKGGYPGIGTGDGPNPTNDSRYANGGDSGNATTTTGQGGGGSATNSNQGSGGGGAGSSGSNGSNGSTNGGNGGTGTLSSITNVSIEYGRGGGGGVARDGANNAKPGNHSTGDNSGRGGRSSFGVVYSSTPGVFLTNYGTEDAYNFPPTVGTRPGNGGGGASSMSFQLSDPGAGGPSKNLGPNPGANGADGAVYVRYKYSDLIA